MAVSNRKQKVYVKPELYFLGEAVTLTLGSNVFGTPHEKDENGQESFYQQ